MEKLRKVIFWIVCILSVIMCIISIINTFKPEWFLWLTDSGYVDKEVFSSLMATFGFGGASGTLGFSIIKTMMSSGSKRQEALSSLTIKEVGETTSKIIMESKNRMEEIKDINNELTDLILGKVKSIFEEITSEKEEIRVLKEEIIKLNELERLNLNKALKNPLVQDSVKDLIKNGLDHLDKKDLNEINVIE